MRRNDQNFNIRTRSPIEDVVRETGYTKFTNIWREFDAIPTWGLTDHIHCLVESRQITCPEAPLTRFVIGHMLKVLNARGFTEKVTHLSKAFAWQRTSSDGIRLDKP